MYTDGSDRVYGLGRQVFGSCCFRRTRLSGRIEPSWALISTHLCGPLSQNRLPFRRRSRLSLTKENTVATQVSVGAEFKVEMKVMKFCNRLKSSVISLSNPHEFVLLTIMIV